MLSTGDSTRPELENDAAPSLSGVKCLIVDDQKDLRRLIGFMLKKSGAQIAEAESVDAALAQLSDFQPDVIVSDLAMPEQSGFDLVRRLREGKEVAACSEIPVVAVSAFTDESTKSRSLREGFQYHLGKPIHRDELLAVVARLSRTTRQEAGPLTL